MIILIGRCVGSMGGLDTEPARGLPKLVKHALVERLESAALGRREVLGKTKRRELEEHTLEAIELGFQMRGSRRDGRRDAGVGTQARERVFEERAALGDVGDAERVDHGERVACAEPVTLDRFEGCVLSVERQMRQRIREGGTESAVGHRGFGAR
jgi:hypothetical protein